MTQVARRQCTECNGNYLLFKPHEELVSNEWYLTCKRCGNIDTELRYIKG